MINDHFSWWQNRILRKLWIIGILLIVVIPSYVIAQDDALAPTGNDGFCILCHTADTEATHTLADGSSLSIAVDHTILNESVHGINNPDGALGCVDCHTTNAFPHTAPPAEDLRTYRINQANLCTACHVEQIEGLADGVHYTALAAGNLRAATCVDCHGSHDVQPPDEPRTHITETCGNCHKIIFREYQQSIHGQALYTGDENVPTCIDCHGVHGINHPTTAQFRNRSPEICAECHGDADLMEEYGLSTHIFESYLTDFHGTTVELFEQQDPNVISNKAVCYDCHGVHDTGKSSSQDVRENLLESCLECHPDATTDFPDSWVGHFEPRLDTYPLLFLVNLFYDFLIPFVLGVFILLVATDIFRRIRNLFIKD